MLPGFKRILMPALGVFTGFLPSFSCCRRAHVGGVHVRQDALRPAEERRGGGTGAARHHPGTAAAVSRKDLRRKFSFFLAFFWVLLGFF